MAKKKKQFSLSQTIGLSIVSMVLGLLIGLCLSVGYALVNVTSDEKLSNTAIGEIYEEFQIYFLELGNIYTGDAIYVKAGENDILIDAGSRPSSKNAIKEYINQYCKDGKLEYVIATHAHQDHIAAFGCSEGIFYSYDIDTIIDFPLTESKTQTYQKYVAGREYAIDNGAEHFTALQCYNEEDGAQKVYSLGEGITMEILYQDYYVDDAASENDYSVCVLFEYNDKKFLLTGDFEAEGEEKLVAANGEKIKDCDLFKAGHHGSYTASTDALLNVVKPKISVCTCVCGSTEYTTNNDRIFPSQDYINRISKHTSQVYVTSLCVDYENGEYMSMNGTIIVSCNGNMVAVACTDNTTVLKDTEWFKNNRVCPEEWK